MRVTFPAVSTVNPRSTTCQTRIRAGAAVAAAVAVVLTAPAAQGRAAIEENCVEFHRTGRPVLIPCQEQVAKPIGRCGLDHWRHNEQHPARLEEALGPAPGGYNK